MKATQKVCRIVLVTLIALLAAGLGLARADDLAVDCSSSTPGAFTSIQAAVNALTVPPPGQWNSISLLSNCTENVGISGQQRLRLQGSYCSIWCGDPPVIITAADANGNVLTVSGSQDVQIDNLVFTGGSNGLFVGGGSSAGGNVLKAQGNSSTGFFVNNGSFLAVYDGSAMNNGNYGAYVAQYGSLLLLGNTPWVPNPQPFLVSGNGNGADVTYGGIYSNGYVTLAGGVVIENNAPDGIFASGPASIGLVPWSNGENVIQNNSVGWRCWEAAQCVTMLTNSVRNNAIAGVEVNYGGIGVFTSQTTIEGNGVAGVQVLNHSHARFNHQSKIRNNGSATEPLRAGIYVDRTSQVLVDGASEVTGNIGPGIIADINSSVDIYDATISGNTEEAVRLSHMSVAEILGTTSTAGNGGGPVACDSSSLVISTLLSRSSKCANIEGAAGGKKTSVTSGSTSLPLSVQEVIRHGQQMAKHSKPPK